MNPSEKDFSELRNKMVKEQLMGRDITDKVVLDVFLRVPRHKFVDSSMHQKAYIDSPLSIGKGQTISQPYIVALMAQVLEINKNDRILEIGTGSGYETAILSELGMEVFSIERIEELAIKAKNILEELGYKNVTIKIADGTLGWPDYAPFDKIIVTAASPSVPKILIDQLKEKGKMAIPVGSKFTQQLKLIEKPSAMHISEKDICGCMFVPLLGKYGFEE